MLLNSALRWFLPVMLLVFSACTEEEFYKPKTVVSLVTISGNEQVGNPGQPLPGNIKVRALDARGEPKAGVLVNFGIALGRGSANPDRVLTNAEGYAETTWTLGPEGEQKLDVRPGQNYFYPVVNQNPTYFSATIAVAGIQKISGDNQIGYVENALAEPVRIRVVDAAGNPVADAPILFEVISGGGSLQYTSPATDAQGFARAFWALGNTEGPQQLKASVIPQSGQTGGNSQVIFTASVRAFMYLSPNNSNPGLYFGEPNEIYFDAAGNLYVTEVGGDRVLKWPAGSQTSVVAAGGNGSGNLPNQLQRPTGLAVDAAGNLYIADSHNDRVQKWAPGATSGITVAGGNGRGPAPNQLNLPSRVQVDAAGNVYVSDFNNHRIQKWSPGATTGQTIAGGLTPGNGPGQLNFPRGLILHSDGSLYIADAGNYRVQKWAPGATSGATVAGGEAGNQAHQFSHMISGIFVDQNHNVYIADTWNDRILKWTPGATAGITVAGNVYGGGVYSLLDKPEDVEVDAAGNIFVADTRRYRIMKWLP